MKILVSVFTGYNYRELLLPLVRVLDDEPEIKEVYVVTPAAEHAASVFPDLRDKYRVLGARADQDGYLRLLDEVCPQVVVTPTNGLEPRDLPLLRAAQQLHIPTLTFIASWDNVYKIERRVKMKKYRAAYVVTDHFAVWNQTMSDHLRRLFPQLSDKQVTVVGAPRLDYLTSPHQLSTRQDVLAALRVPDDGKKLIHVATTELYPSDYILRALHHARGREIARDFNLLVSVHPGGSLARHAQYARPFGAYVAYSFGRQTHAQPRDFQYAPTLSDIKLHAALFRHANLLINHSSTVTIESIIADTPVINVKYGRPFDWWRWYRSMVYRDFKQHARVFIQSKATRVVTSARALVRTADVYLQHPVYDRDARARLAAQLITYTDGRAARRLLDLILKIGHASASL